MCQIANGNDRYFYQPQKYDSNDRQCNEPLQYQLLTVCWGYGV
jgi:hypothetical protein